MSTRKSHTDLQLVINKPFTDQKSINEIGELANARLVANGTPILPIPFAAEKKDAIFFKIFERMMKILYRFV